MATFSGLGIGLSFLFGCVLLGFAAELYYLLWWKKKREDIENQNFSSSNYTPTHLSSCFKNPNSSKTHKTHQKDLQNHEKQDSEMGLDQDQLLKSIGEESLDLELMRLHNLCGPPRFLFTINEETKEDLDAEKSKKGSRTRSLSDLLATLDTPMASPPLKVTQESHLNPLFDFDSKEFDFNKMRSSPPATFKFLRDAEEKLLKRLMEKREDSNGTFVNLVGCKGKSEGGVQNHQVSTPSQVLPLASSPSK